MLSLQPSISILMPVYNDYLNLRAAVEEVSGFLAQRALDYEIVVIESGSTDGTSELADEIGRNMGPRVVVVHEDKRNGFGSAMRKGIAAAKKDWIWLVTADIPFPLTTLDAVLPKLETVDFVCSYRAEDKRSKYRKVQSAVFNALTKILLNLRCKSVNSAFKIYRKSMIQGYKIHSDGWFFDAEIHYIFQSNGSRIWEIGVPLIDRQLGKSTVRWNTCVKVLKEMLVFLVRVRIRPFPAKLHKEQVV